MQGVRVVFFDIDDTLYDFEASYDLPLATVRAEWPQAFAAHDPAALRRLYWKAFEDLDTATKWDLIRRDLGAYRRALWTRVFELGGIRGVEPQAVADRFHEVRFAHLAPFPGAREALHALAAKYRLGVLSNGPGNLQRGKLAALGVTDLFDRKLVFVSGEFGEDKPAPGIFRAAVKAAECEAAACAFVGDNPALDLPSKAVGMRFVHFDPRRKGVPSGTAHVPDATVHDYPSLLRLL